MATSVLLACGLNETLPATFTFVREECDVDASFLITCILGQRTKVQTAGTVLVCVHHRFKHYVGAGERLGFNLEAARKRGTLVVIDPMSDASQITAPDDMLLQLWNRIVEEARALQTAGERKSVTIILDDATALIDLGVPEDSVLWFCRRLCQLAAEWEAPALGVVVKLSACNLYQPLASNLVGLADTDIQCIRLRSGHFREVDGRLTVKRSDMMTAKSMLYKVTDRNVKIFAPGEVGISI